MHEKGTFNMLKACDSTDRSFMLGFISLKKC